MLWVVLALVIGQQSASAYECLSCKNVPSLNSCHTFTSCGLNEVCYVDNLMAPDGNTRFNLGCRQNWRCPTSMDSLSTLTTWLKSEQVLQDSTLMCSECCFATMCNKQGCGDDGKTTSMPQTTASTYTATTSATTTTLAPTTLKTTTLAPTTVKTTTLAPTTVKTTTLAPTTLKTTTLAPTTLKTTTLAPTTLKTTTLAPTTLKTTTLAPTTLKTTTLAPTTLKTTTLAPTTLKPDICQWNPCQHGGICSHDNYNIIKCTCQSGYYGDRCEHVCNLERVHYISASYHTQQFEYALITWHHYTYPEALQYCKEHCGQLMKVTTKEKWEAITHMLNNGYSDYGRHTYWIDGKAVSTNVWQTSTGEDITMSRDVWRSGHPDQTYDQCVEMYSGYGHGLSNSYCNNHLYFICEKEVVQATPLTTRIPTAPLTTQMPIQIQIPDACHSNPCQYGRICSVQANNQFTCKCPSGFYGTYCEHACRSLNWDTLIQLTAGNSVMIGRSTSHMTYDDSEKYCESHCGELLHITGTTTRQLVEDYLVHKHIGHTYWINGRGTQSNRVWTTSTGQDIPYSTSLWASDPTHRSHDYCLTIEDDSHYKLLNYQCSFRMYALCQKL